MSSRDHRRAPRKAVDIGVTAMDMISEQALGTLCNVSSSGLMLIGGHKPRSGGIYQVRLTLSGSDGPLELGLQEQWHDAAASPGQYWVGYRIIAVAKTHEGVLERWLRNR